MIVLLVFAFISGIVTILSPCILPILPIVLSGSVGGKSRPYGVVLGFVASFSIFTLALSTLVQALSIPPNALRIAAVVLIVSFGLVMLIPKLRHGFEAAASRLTSRRRGPKKSRGFGGGLLVGVSLGLVWTPCVGPILASVISLAVTRSVNSGSVFIILAYSLGTSIPMLAIMLGGRTLVNRVPSIAKHSGRIQQVFGVLMILVGASIGFGLDRRFQSAVLQLFPNYGSGLTAIENTEPVRRALNRRSGSRTAAQERALKIGDTQLTLDDQPEKGRLGDYGPAPRIVTDGKWFNSPPLTMADLKGKVVLVDFWTYSCVNCVRTLPHLRAWYDAYKDKGLVIIGVHTPEFAFERRPENVQKAMKELGVTWPVVLDNAYTQWNAYSNRYWPAHYFIDARGRVRYFHFGEGGYDTAEKVIRELLGEAGLLTSGRSAAKAEAPPAARLESSTAETYLGYSRSEHFISAKDIARDRSAVYHTSGTPGNGEWSLDGTWIVKKEYIVPDSSGTLELGFDAKDVYLVIEPFGTGGKIGVRIDGKTGPDTPDVRNGTLQPKESRLYQLAELKEPGKHILHIEVNGNLRLYAFTFG